MSRSSLSSKVDTESAEHLYVEMDPDIVWTRLNTLRLLLLQGGDDNEKLILNFTKKTLLLSSCGSNPIITNDYWS